jgi:hypothetical protein
MFFEKWNITRRVDKGDGGKYVVARYSLNGKKERL